MMLTGTYQRNLDEKRRISLPKRFRQALNLDSKSSVYLAPGTNHSLQIHTLESLNRLASELGQQSAGVESTQTFSRMFYAQAECCELDSQYRICLPARLADWAELDKEVVLLGVGVCIEIWKPERWSNYFDQRKDEFDVIVYQAFSKDAPVKSADGLEADKESAEKPRPK